MAIQFPDNPNVGDMYEENNIVWTWDGVKWTSSGTGSAEYLPLTGGTMSGPINIPGGPPNLALAGGTSRQVLSTNGSSGLSWEDLDIPSSTVISDTPPTNPSNGDLWFDSIGAQLYIWYDDGTSSQWVIATNASDSLQNYLLLAGGTLTGPLVLNADPTTALEPATKEYVDNANDAIWSTGGLAGGFVNKIRNPGIDVWQRLSPISAAAGAGTYTADGWLVGATGVACSVSQSTGQMGGLSHSKNNLTLTAASGLTAIQISQRIESSIAAQLANRTCTLQLRIANNTLIAVTPILLASYANVVDNFSAVTPDLTAVNLQTIPSGGNGIVAYTFNVSPNANLGYVFTVMFGNVLNATSGNIAITDSDFRITPGLSTGLNNNPPPIELRPIGIELAYCQRYYSTGEDFFNGNVGNATGYFATEHFVVRMRAVPTVVLANASSSNFSATPGGITSIGGQGFRESRAATATVLVAWFGSTYTASAEL